MVRRLLPGCIGRIERNLPARSTRSFLAYKVGLPLMVLSLITGCVSNPSKDEAKTGTKRAIVVSPEARADFDAAMALMNAGDYQKGIEKMNGVVAKSQNNPVPYINLAIAYGKLGKMKESEDNLKLALNLDPENPVANNEYGILYRKTGRFKEARQVYEQLLTKYPYYPMVHKNLGILCDIYLRDYACAVKEYEAYSEAKPEDKTVKIWIADTKTKVGK